MHAADGPSVDWDARAVRRAAWTVAALACVAQAWMLGLPFQLDDYGAVGDPWHLFSVARELRPEENLGLQGFMMRWTLWSVWGLVRLPLDAPLDATPFHVVGWLLHALCAALVASLAARVAHGRLQRPARAGLVAGALFGIGGGWIQAASWIAAWGDLLMTLFGLLALRALWPLPAGAGRATPHARPALAGLALALSLFSKEPAALVALGLAALLVARAFADRGARPRLGSSLLAIALPLALVTLTRWWYLGSPVPRYGSLGPPALGELPALAWRAAGALRQGLAPWNRDPCFSDLAPITARLGAFHAGWLCALLLVLLGVARCRNVRWVLLAAAGLAIAWALPTGILLEASGTNVQGRTLYLPMSAAATAIGIACAAALEHASRAQRAAAALLALALAAATIDGGVHVARTEHAAAGEIALQRRALDELLARASSAPSGAPGPNVLVVFPEAGMGGVPVVGDVLGQIYGAPFADPLPPTVHFALSLPDLWADLPALTDPTLALCVLAPTAVPYAPAVETGAALRAARILRPLGPSLPGRTAEPRSTRLEAGAIAPHSAHALANFSVLLEGGPAGSGTLLLDRGPDATALEIALAWEADSTPRRLPVMLAGDASLWLGPPVIGLGWHGPAEPRCIGLERADRAALIEPLAPLNDRVALRSPETTAATAWRVRPAPDASWPGSARLELRILAGAFSVPLVAEGLLGARADDGSRTFVPRSLREASSPAPGAAWSAFVEEALVPQFLARQRTTVAADWRLVFLHAPGSLAGASPWSRVLLDVAAAGAAY